MFVQSADGKINQTERHSGEPVICHAWTRAAGLTVVLDLIKGE